MNLWLYNVSLNFIDIILALNQCKYIKSIYNLKDVELLSQCIWGNEYCKNQGKTIYFKHWIRNGIVYVKDLLDNNGNISQEHILRKLESKSSWISEYMTIISPAQTTS